MLFLTWNLTEKTSNQILNLYHVVTAEVEHGYASSLPGPFILESESYTQTRDLKQGLTTVVQSEINGAPSNYNPSNRRLKTNNRKPQGNRKEHTCIHLLILKSANHFGKV